MDLITEIRKDLDGMVTEIEQVKANLWRLENYRKSHSEIEASVKKQIEAAFPEIDEWQFVLLGGEANSAPFKLTLRANLDEELFDAFAPWMEWNNIDLYGSELIYEGAVVISDGLVEIRATLRAKAKDVEGTMETLRDLGKIYESEPSPYRSVICR